MIIQDLLRHVDFSGVRFTDASIEFKMNKESCVRIDYSILHNPKRMKAEGQTFNSPTFYFYLNHVWQTINGNPDFWFRHYLNVKYGDSDAYSRLDYVNGHYCLTNEHISETEMVFKALEFIDAFFNYDKFHEEYVNDIKPAIDWFVKQFQIFLRKQLSTEDAIIDENSTKRDIKNACRVFANPDKANKCTNLLMKNM